MSNIINHNMNNEYGKFLNIVENLCLKDNGEIQNFCAMCFRFDSETVLGDSSIYLQVLQLLSIPSDGLLSQHAFICDICNCYIQKMMKFREEIKVVKMINELIVSQPVLCRNILLAFMEGDKIVNYPNIITDHIKKLNSQLNDLPARKLSITVPFIISCDQYEENERIWLEKDQKSEGTFREVSENFHSDGGLTETLTTQCKYVQETESMINNNIINPMGNNYNKDNEFIDPLKLYSDLLKEEFSDNLLNESSVNSIAIKTEVEEDPLANIENCFSKQVVKNANYMRDTKLVRLPGITKLKSIAKNNISKSDLVLPYNLTPKFRIVNSKQYLHTKDIHVKKSTKGEELSRIWIGDKTVQVKRKTAKNVDKTAQNIDETERRVREIATARSVDKKVWNVYKIANNLDRTARNVGKTVQKHDRLTPSKYMENKNKYNELKVDKNSKFYREPMIAVKDGKIIIDCKQKYTKRKIALNPYSIDSKTKLKTSKKVKDKVATHRSENSSKQPTPVMLKKSVIDTRIDLNDNNINTEKNARCDNEFILPDNTVISPKKSIKIIFRKKSNNSFGNTAFLPPKSMPEILS